MNPIAGSRPPLKPWQYATAGVVVLAAVVAVPSLMHLMQHKEPPQLTTDELPTGASRPWQPPESLERPMPMPAQQHKPVERPPPPMPQAQPTNVSSAINIAKNMDTGADAKAAGGDGGVEKAAAHQPDELEARLQPTVLNGVRASRIKDLDMKILQGRQIPCIDQTAINTSYPGTITAVVPQDIRGSDAYGTVPLIDAGSTVFGTMQHGMLNGMDRQFVLWQQITTPSGVRIAVSSPAADELGRSGLDVDVNRHFWQKLEGALLVSIANGGGQALSSLAGGALNGSGGTNINTYEFQNMGNQAGDALAKGLIDIPDVGTRNQGAACSIAVVRDLDFSKIYRLESRDGHVYRVLR